MARKGKSTEEIIGFLREAEVRPRARGADWRGQRLQSRCRYEAGACKGRATKSPRQPEPGDLSEDSVLRRRDCKLG
jgi:hypothetical protein